MNNLIFKVFSEHIELMSLVAAEQTAALGQVAVIIADAITEGHKVMVMGNGGSAADAQHFVAELVGRFMVERRAFGALCLSGDMASLTAISNDHGFAESYRRQVEGLAQQGDVVVAISTSGCSENVLSAVIEANSIGCKTIGLLGGDGGSIAAQVDMPLIVPSQQTPRIQEAHITMIHILCMLVEQLVVEREA